MAALTGIRVLDLTRVVSGPFCTMQLGDLGAEVIKVEEVNRGDESRAFGPPFIEGESAYYLSVNRNKAGIAVNLKVPEGAALVRRLAQTADVLVENFRPGTMERLGLGAASLRAANPRLVYCAISGFGSAGTDAQRPAYDLVIQGESGVMDVTGDPAGPPTKVGASIGDLVAGLYATQGVLAALHERGRTGVGKLVEISMLDGLASLLTFNAGSFFATGNSPTRRGNTHPSITPYETFKAADGWMNVAIANDKFWQLFCDAVGSAELAEDQRFTHALGRVAHRSEVVAAVAAIIARHGRAHWMSLLGAAGVPCGLIRSIGEVCEAPALTQRGMVLEMLHPLAGNIRNINSPLVFDGQTMRDATPPPMHAQHSRSVLRDVLALDDAAIDDLVARKVIAEHTS